MKKFLETYKLQKLTHEGIENMCVCTMSKEIESVTRNVSMKKSLAPEDFTGEFHQTFFFFFEQDGHYTFFILAGVTRTKRQAGDTVSVSRCAVPGAAQHGFWLIPQLCTRPRGMRTANKDM